GGQGNLVESGAGPGLWRRGYGWAPPEPAKGVKEPDTPGRSAAYSELDLYVPPGFVCGPHDRVRVNGRVFDVIGELSDYTFGPFGFKPGGRISLKRVGG